MQPGMEVNAYEALCVIYPKRAVVQRVCAIRRAEYFLQSPLYFFGQCPILKLWQHEMEDGKREVDHDDENGYEFGQGG